jgi:hypothetical protein
MRRRRRRRSRRRFVVPNTYDLTCPTLLQGLLEKYLIANAGTAESKVFYLKMKGDYLR